MRTMAAQRKLFTGVLLTACVLWAQSVSTDTPPPSNGPLKRPQLVTLNLVAFDGHGQPVGDLTSDDFQIQDQGKRQQVVFFRHNESKPRTSDALAPHQYSNRSGATVQQATVILLDLLDGEYVRPWPDGKESIARSSISSRVTISTSIS